MLSQSAGLVLGVESNIWDMSDADLQASKDFMIKKKKNLYNIWVDFTAMWDDVKQDNVWAVYAWPDAWLNTYKDAPTKYIRPKEGVLSWGEGLMLNATPNTARTIRHAWTNLDHSVGLEQRPRPREPKTWQVDPEIVGLRPRHPEEPSSRTVTWIASNRFGRLQTAPGRPYLLIRRRRAPCRRSGPQYG
jgi:hypothetical protein